MTEQELEAIYEELVAHPSELYGYIRAMERLVESYRHVVQLCPPCPAHGDTCAPHAEEWIVEHRARELGLWEEKNA